LRELDTKYTIQSGGYKILEAAAAELKNSINIEINKCNRYRDQIAELVKKAQQLTDLEKKYYKLKNEHRNFKESIARLTKDEKELIFTINDLKQSLIVKDNQIKDLESRV
jgi:predicted  nucleic acid-binding Zn-ribbon protein